ncbi:uncharacterized protein LOC135140163 [Zophobas morio]|uniref:uncharacterized protein LOC135140163 n=1 Tax=Zophobas morio TaxID=2755281 RepID=UPI0030828A94
MSTTNHFALFFISMFLIIFITTVHSSISTTNNHLKTKINTQHLNSLHKQIRAKEEELKNAEEINKNFERMIQFVNILGQVDNFVSEKTKVLIKKLAILVEDEEKIKRHYRVDDSEEDDY